MIKLLKVLEFLDDEFHFHAHACMRACVCVCVCVMLHVLSRTDKAVINA
jgi:hypothetical protein